MDIILKPIGFISSCYKEKFATPRQSGLIHSSHAQIKLLPYVQPEESLAGLERFTHFWVLFWFHKNSNKNFCAKVAPPRLAGGKTGVFASRSPHRPNPIGLSLVRLKKIKHDTLFISGVDFIEGTPVLDIKPYIADTESIPHAGRGWLEDLETIDFRVEFSEEATSDLNLCGNSTKLKQIIEESLSLDPRPTIYKGDGDEPNPYREVYGALIDDYNVRFTITGEIVTILSVKK